MLDFPERDYFKNGGKREGVEKWNLHVERWWRSFLEHSVVVSPTGAVGSCDEHVVSGLHLECKVLHELVASRCDHTDTFKGDAVATTHAGCTGLPLLIVDVHKKPPHASNTSLVAAQLHDFTQAARQSSNCLALRSKDGEVE